MSLVLRADSRVLPTGEYREPLRVRVECQLLSDEGNSDQVRVACHTGPGPRSGQPEASAGLTAVERSFRVGDCETSDEDSKSLPVALAESVPGP